ncbi:MFS general substrate transporter, partial [Thozetella sp. PMI_491]
DRGSIGNARIMGFQEDLGLPDQQFFNCLMLFFVGYAAFEGPVFVLIRKFHAPSVYAISLLIFGMCAILMAFAKSYAAVLVLRLFIGLGEAAVMTAFLYTSLWYRREEIPRLTRTDTGYIFAMTPVAGAITGLMSYGIQRGLEDHDGLHSWQWLFIIEGAATMGWALILWILLPEMPEKEIAKKRSLFIRSDDEKRLIVMRSEAAHHVMHAKMNYSQMWLAIKDPKAWLMALLFATHASALNGFSVFLPTFVNEFGFSRLVTQLYTIIPYAVAFFSLQLTTWLSDRYVMRAIPMYILSAIATLGYIIIIAQTNPAVGVFASCLVVGSVYPGVIIISGWMPSSSAGYTKRAMAIWIAQITVQLFSIMVTEVYDSPPRFFKGHGIQLGLFALSFVEIWLLRYLMKRHNDRKDAQAAEWAQRGETNPDESKTFEDLCDDHPHYRYIY